MGIYDRDYYRKEGPSFLGSFAIRGQVCKWLIIGNIIVFVLQLLTRTKNVNPFTGEVLGHLPGPFTQALWLDTQQVFNGQVWRLLTYAFLHDTDYIWHIIINMWVLWLFGPDLEEMYGRWEFLAFYLVSAFLGGLVFLGTGAMESLRVVGTINGLPSICLGASGAVTAVLVLCAIHYPHRTILLMFILPVPLWALAVLQVVQDSYRAIAGNNNGVAVTVHLAGAGFAALYYKLNWRLMSLWPKKRIWQRQRSRPRLRVYREEEVETPQPVPVPAPPASDVDEQLEAKLDAVLAKVARTGQASLTEKERAILLRASEVYKKRRS
jgi:membrane associated rhomboid family serine protease